MSKKVWSKIGKVFGQVLMYAFLVFCAVLVVSSMSMKKSKNDALTIFGYQARLIETASMDKSAYTDPKVDSYKIKDLEVHTLVFIETVPTDEEAAKKWFDSLQVGDVLTFRYVYNGQKTITHRITEKIPMEGGYKLILTGDNRASEDHLNMQQEINTWEHFDSTCFNYVIGKVTGESYLLGLLLYSLSTPIGTFCIIIIPCVIIIIMEIVRIVYALGEEKRKKVEEEKLKAEEEKKVKEEEIERLREQLARLQPTQASEEPTESAKQPTENTDEVANTQQETDSTEAGEEAQE